MQPLFTPEFAATREAALQQLKDFVPRSGRYSRDRNHVLPDHSNVSRLSPAIRHGLLSIEECTAAVLKRYAPSTVEKFIQELNWRRYWKAWLSLRPQVWQDYLRQLQTFLHETRHAELRERAAECAAGKGPIAIMNHFANELTTTGYMHNHARMWFAAWWIHVERLPWQLGADFFFQHLLDADPASNTLSWKWVAGHQTPGKTYLPRRSNLEKYLHPDLLHDHSTGLHLLEKPSAFRPDPEPKPSITAPDLPAETPQPDLRTGLWIHEEDLHPEDAPLSTIPFAAAILTQSVEPSDHSLPRSVWRRKAFTDTRQRVGSHFELPVEDRTKQPLTPALVNWARTHRLEQVIVLRPDIGPLHDLLPNIRKALKIQGTHLTVLDRPEQRELRPLATAGFFHFWQEQQRALKGNPTG